MAYKRIEIAPEVSLEWLLSNGYIEPCDPSSSHQYRVSIDPDTSRTYTITHILTMYAKHFGVSKKTTRNRAIRREMYKCFDEYQIGYMKQYEKSCEYWLFEETYQKYLEQKLNIDMNEMNEYDSNHKGNGRRWTAYWKRVLNKYGEELALKFFKAYFERRMKDLSADLRHGKPRSLLGKRFFKHKQPLEAVEST
jgi:hypothetical protein